MSAASSLARSLARRRRADSPGSIPEIEEKTDSIFNCATAYDPQGGKSAPGAIDGISELKARHAVLILLIRQARGEAQEGALVRY